MSRTGRYRGGVRPVGAQTHSARVSSLLTRASDTTLRLLVTNLADFLEARLNEAAPRRTLTREVNCLKVEI
jgi:hypothetical protein